MAALCAATLALAGFGPPAAAAEFLAQDVSDITRWASQAQPGDIITMRDGNWVDVDIGFKAIGTAGNPITLRAQTPGQVLLTGNSRLRIAGAHLVVDGLVFTNGFVTAGDVIAFQHSPTVLATNCRVTSCMIVDYNPPADTDDTKWISLYGLSNRVDNCYLKGKRNLGSTLVVWVDGRPDSPNYHRIDHNYFGPRPSLGGNGGETIRIGTSDVSMNPSRTIVEHNLLEQCNGDVEIISVKAGENILRHNTFVESEGGLCLRHGNGTLVEGNYFLGRLKARTGGVRIIGEDHRVVNNYFADLTGTAARAPLVIMQGLVNSPLYGYFQVKRATVAFNTFVNCTPNVILGLAGTLSGSTEVTTLPPVDCAFANNLMLAPSGKMIDQRLDPINMRWEGNILFGSTLGIVLNHGIQQTDPRLEFTPDGLWRPRSDSPALGAAQGTYADVTQDFEGHARPTAKDVGCDQRSADAISYPPLTPLDVGPIWMRTQGTLVIWSNPADLSYGAPLGAAQLNARANVPGAFVYTPPAGTVLNAATGQVLTTVFRPTDLVNFTVVTQTVTLNVRPARPTITWTNPPAITFGTLLGAAQLNATAPAPGSFVYVPPAGTRLNAGSGQTLSAIFTPSNTSNYLSVTQQVTLTVNKATPVLTWPAPAGITNGTPLGPVQLNATAHTAGSFAYNPPAGTVLNTGNGQILSVTFTPLDPTNYTTATRTVTINVSAGGKQTPVITWLPPAAMTNGVPLSSAQLNATANVAGSFAYNPPAGTVLDVGNGQVLSVAFTPANPTNYTTASKTVTINVLEDTSRVRPMVRVAYLLPTNRVAQAQGPTNLQLALRLYQQWFREQMSLHGFGPKTFLIETESDRITPKIHLVPLAERDSDLAGDIWGGRVVDAARAAGVPVGTPAQIWWLVPESHVQNPDGSISGRFDLGFTYGGSGDDAGWAILSGDALAMFASTYLTNNADYSGWLIPELGPYPLRRDVTFFAFEGTSLSSISSSMLGEGLRQFGEAFGLDLDYRNDENFHGNVMGYGFRGLRGVLHPTQYPYNYTRLSYASALALNASPYFNPNRQTTDIEKPTASITVSGARSPVGGLLRISFTAADAGGLAAAHLCWQKDSEQVLVEEMALSGPSASRTFATTYYDAGRTNDYTLLVFDSQGNKQSATARLFVNPGFNHAPVPFLKVSPASASLGEDVVLAVSGSTDPEHATALLEVEWDVDGDGIFDTEPTTTLLFTNRYTTLGGRLIRARVTDPAGAEAISAPVAIHITPCPVILSPLARTHGYGASTGTVSVTTTTRCDWQIQNTNAWISFTIEANGPGGGTLRYMLDPNPAFLERTGVLLIGDQPFTVTQRPLVCTYSLSPLSRYHGYGTGSGTVKISTRSDCGWTVVNTNAWVTLTSSPNGVGSGSVSYTVTENRAADFRSGTLRIDGEAFIVGQWGTNCAYVITPTERVHSAGTTTGLVSVASSSACAWTVENTNAWVTLLGAPSGLGSAGVGYLLEPNPHGVTRTARLKVAGETFTITQLPCAYELTPATLTHGSGVENGLVSVGTDPTCHWSVSNPNPWITLTSAASGDGSGSVSYRVNPNPTGAMRLGVLSVGGQPFEVRQAGSACLYALAPEDWVHGEGEDVGEIAVLTAAGCPWEVSNPNDWIHLLFGASGVGSGSILYYVDANAGPARYGTLEVAGQEFAVQQASGLRYLRVSPATVPAGQTFCLPVTFEARGIENQLSFSLNFATNRLTFASAQLALGGTGATLSVQTNQAAQGRVAMTLTLPAGRALSPGLQTLLQACFRSAVLEGAATTVVSVTDDPLPRQVLDVLGQPVPVSSGDGTVRLLGECTLAVALDAPTLTWSTTTSLPWSCQTNLTHDAEDAAWSAAIADSQTSTLSTTVTGPGTVSFWWKVSSEPSNDRLRFYVGGSTVATISGEVNWEYRTFAVGSGSQTLEWRYSKNSSVSAGLDRGWVDQVVFQPAAPSITTQPVNRTVDQGTTVSFQISATGTPPLAYQWYRDGVPLVNGSGVSGATTATLNLTAVQVAQSGFYSATVSNAVGYIASSEATLNVTPILPLAEALDTPGWTWTTSGSTPTWIGQPVVNFDGEDAARSGAITHSQNTSMQTTLTGPGTVTFWWKVSCETNNDRLMFYIGSSEQARISGEVDWQQRTFNLPSGSQTVRWTYSKSSSSSLGQDRGWVDRVEYGPMAPVVTTQPVSRQVDAGTTVNFSVVGNGSPTLLYQWQFNGADLTESTTVRGTTTPSLTLSNVPPAQAGAYSVVIRNAAGTATSADAQLNVTPVLPLAEAVDAPTLTWTTTGSAAWIGQPEVSRDGEDAARSGPIGHSQTTTLRTTVVGPGTISFWWKVSSEPSNDRLRFYEASSERANISGEVDWQWRSYTISSGSRVLEWRYVKSSSTVAGQDRAWVDRVIWVPNATPTPPTVVIPPPSRTNVAGTSTSFNVGVAGTTPFSYQWWFNGAPLANATGISGATTTNLSLSSVQASNAGTYAVLVSNVAGIVTSPAATLTVIAAPVITNQPVSQDVIAGSTVTFRVGAIGLAPLSYQWQFNGTNLVNGGGVSGATTATLTLSSVTAARAGTYSVLVSNAAGTTLSSGAAGSVATWDAARTGAIPDGENTRMEAWVTGPGTVSFWWKVSSQINGDDLRFYIGDAEQARISGEVNWQQETFDVPDGPQLLKWRYAKDASGSAGEDAGWVDAVVFTPSGPATAPSFVTPPESQNVLAGSTVVLAATVSGTPPLSYQWRFNGSDLANGTGVSGTTTPRLTLAGVQASRAGAYTLIVSNAAGSATSPAAALSVTPVLSAPVITVQPAARVAGEGGTATFTVGTAGTPPMSYQWQYNGVDLANGPGVSGATSPTLTLDYVQAAHIGSYSVVVSNAVGHVVSAGAPLTLLSLADAADAPYWDFYMAGYTSWVAQTSVTHDGVDAARSGAIPDNQNTRLEAWVEGPGTVSFWWKVSSQASGDQVRFYVGSTELGRISGEVDWQRLSFDVPAGIQLLKWRYSKDASGSAGQDAAWVDQVEFVFTGTQVTPVFTNQPVSQTVLAGATVAFTAAASSAPATYQWRRNGAALTDGAGVSGARSARLMLANVQPGQTGVYSLLVSNSVGTALSEGAALDVIPVLSAPSITSQPASQSVSEGATASFAAVASGTAPLSYRWQFNGVNLSDGGGVRGVTTSSLTVSNAQAAQAGNYTVVVSNGAGQAVSAPAALIVQTLGDAVDAAYLDFAGAGFTGWTLEPGVTHQRGGAMLSVSTPPSITTQPISRSRVAGDSVTFTVAAAGTAPLGYRWRFNGTFLQDGLNVSGAQTPSLTLANVQAAQAGSYSAVVTNAVGSATSSNANLTVLIPPVITLQPASRNVAEGDTVTFTVTATGTAPLSYQWRFNGTNLSNGGGVSGATTASLTLTNLHPLRSGAYSVVVNNTAGAALSANAMLSVKAALTLAESMNATYLDWLTDLSLPWVAQTNLSYDGLEAARSATITHGQTTWLESTVTGPGTLRFWWKVSSETNRDVLRFLVNGDEWAALSGETDWQWQNLSLPAGRLTLRWTYSKDSTGSAGQDRGWVDQVQFTPSAGPTAPMILSHPAGQNVAMDATVTLSVEAIGSAPLMYQWRYDGVDLADSANVSGATTPTLTLQHLTPAQSGAYSIVVRNPYSIAVSAGALVTVAVPPTIAEAADTPGWVWILGGASPWVGQTRVNSDWLHATESGPLSDNQTNWLETSVFGPGAISFWWKASSQTNRDRLRFFINGVEQANLTGEMDWRWRTFDVTNVVSTFRWAYTKDASGIAGQDRGWLDQVQFGPSAPIITDHPMYATAETGATVYFDVDVTGSKPLNYIWRFNGALLPNSGTVTGATTKHLILSNAQLANAGAYSVIVDNLGGRQISSNAMLSLFNGRPLSQALETSNVVWNSGWVTGGDAAWTAQTSVTYDGVDAAQSGLIGDGKESWLETTVMGPGKLSFWWRTSSETDWDRLRLYIGGVNTDSASGVMTNWVQKTFDVPPGRQALRWRYQKNGSVSNGLDRAWLDQVQYVPIFPPVFTSQPVSQEVDPGSTVTFSTAVSGSSPFAYQWRHNGVNLVNGGSVSGANTTTLRVTGVQLAQAGNYSVTVSNAAAIITSTNALLTIVPGLPLPEALDTPGWVWTTSGSPTWVGQTQVSRDGVDAARSGTITHSQTATMQTTVTGPGVVTFWWKVSSELDNDRLRFYVDGSSQLTISGEVDWQWQMYNLSSGSHTLEWRYSKNGSVSLGQDRGWVDQVQFSDGAIAPVITRHPTNQTVGAGLTATLSAAAGGSTPLNYQWRYDGVDLVNGSGVSGATSATLSLANVQPSQAGLYSVVVNNAVGSATSSNAVLTVDTAASIVTHPLGRTVAEGSTVRLTVVASGAGLNYQWRFNTGNLANGGTISGANSATLTISNIQPAQAGSYSVVVSNPQRSVTSSNAVVSVIPVLPLGDALDLPTWTWTTTAATPWLGQPVVTHDGVDAAWSGTIADNETATMQTTVAGPGTISFWWKVSSEPSNDRLRFYIGGSTLATISGEVDWELRTFDIPSGNQTLEWRYSKNGSVSAGQDQAWVDQVQFQAWPPVITAQPTNRMADAGTTVAMTVGVSGTPPLTYQWRYNGSPLANGSGVSGATTATLTLTAAQPARSGTYSLVISNVMGQVVSSNAVLTITPVFTLAEALDTPGLTWTTNGNPPWIGQPVETHDGVDAARSGAIGNSTTTSMETTVNGPLTVNFWWKVSCETNNDRLLFYIGSTEQARISGEVNWQQRTFSVPSGSQVLRWTYSKNSSTVRGQDRGWVDQVQFGTIAPTFTSQPTNQTVDSGTTVSLAVTTSGTPPLGYQWRREGVPLVNGPGIAGATSPTLTLSNVQPAQSGTYSVVVSNASATITSAGAVLTVIPLLPLAEALDTPGWTWTTTGTPAWVGQPVVSQDGVDAARSGAITHSQTASMQTTVTGPGTLSFWWKVSSEPSNDRLLFYFGSSEQARISGEVDWQLRTFNVPSGNQTLRWTYSKNGSTTTGQDRGWVDQVIFIPAGTPVAPTITSQPRSVVSGEGATVTVNVSAAGSLPLTYRWFYNGDPVLNSSNIAGADTSSLVLSNLQPSQAGSYSVVVSNSVGTATSTDALLTVITLAEAVDAQDLLWSGAGNASWFAQNAVTHDGTDAARSGAIADGQNTRLETWLTGPGTVSFWWKVSSEPSNDQLRFYVGDTEQERISGEVDWQLRTFDVPAGLTLLKWRYSKNASTVRGQDAAWVDQIAYVPTGAPAPAPALAPASTLKPSLRIADGKTLLTWNAVPGHKYRVLYKNSLTDSDWTTIPGTIVATDFVAQIEDQPGSQAQRFYRVVEE